jgi:hypothetical protein
MGAEFIFAITKYVDPGVRELFTRRVDTLTQDARDVIIDSFLSESVPQDSDGIEEIKELLQEAFKHLDVDESRDFAVVELDGVPYWLAGGMTWGDTPSEACDYIWLIDSIQG